MNRRITNLPGTLRRFYLAHFRKDCVAQMRSLREGECKRCGNCCRLVVKCIFLRHRDGQAACARYGSHPPNCSLFPFDQRDVDDVKAVAPDAACGFSFRSTSTRSDPPCG